MAWLGSPSDTLQRTQPSSYWASSKYHRRLSGSLSMLAFVRIPQIWSGQFSVSSLPCILRWERPQKVENSVNLLHGFRTCQTSQHSTGCENCCFVTNIVTCENCYLQQSLPVNVHRRQEAISGVPLRPHSQGGIRHWLQPAGSCRCFSSPLP